LLARDFIHGAGKGVPVFLPIQTARLRRFPIVISASKMARPCLTATSRETSSLFGREKDSELPVCDRSGATSMFCEFGWRSEAGFG